MFCEARATSWEGDYFIPAHIQFVQLCEFADGGGQSYQAIRSQIEEAQVFELAQSTRQPLQSIVAQVEMCQMSEFAE